MCRRGTRSTCDNKAQTEKRGIVMDFSDSAEQAEYRAAARAWLAEHAPRHEIGTISGMAAGVASEDDLKRGREWQALKAEAGWAGIHWPTEYGGQGLSQFHAILFNSEEARYELPIGFFSIGLRFCAPTLMAYASEGQKERYLPRLLRGEEIWCQLFSEPGAGSDLAGLRTRAVPDGDEWVVNGQKIWTTYAHLSDFGILVTRHDVTLPKHKGLTFFFVDMRSAGVEARPIKQISGSSSFNEVFFTDVRIPDSQRLGGVGEGWQVAITTLMHERLGASSADQPPDFHHAFELARGVRLESGPALADSAIRQRLADWYVASRGLELIHWRTLTALSHGGQPGPEASIRKLVAANKQAAIASFALDLQELGGVLADGDLSPQEALFQRCYLQCPGSRLAGGSDEVLRNILAERVLGLPGDIRVDRDRPFKEIPTGHN
jgi:alkylation response protein AidB-like acyl-CoA dehydrogenase